MVKTEEHRQELESLLWDLHKELARFYLEMLRNADSPPKGSTLGAINDFLRVNRITLPNCDRVKGSDFNWAESQLEDMASMEDPNFDLVESVTKYSQEEEEEEPGEFKILQ